MNGQTMQLTIENGQNYHPQWLPYKATHKFEVISISVVTFNPPHYGKDTSLLK